MFLLKGLGTTLYICIIIHTYIYIKLTAQAQLAINLPLGSFNFVMIIRKAVKAMSQTCKWTDECHISLGMTKM